MESANKKKEN